METDTTQESAGTRMREAAHKTYMLPKMRLLERAVATLSPFERILFWLLAAAFILSAFIVFVALNEHVTTPTPVRGGTLHEGVIGAPRFINPLLALSDTDRDLTALIYAGLTRPSADGTLIPDLAERYSISEDGTEYTFVLRDSARFHDGVAVTADDIVFTVTAAQDSNLRSPRRADWDGVSVERVNDRTVRFTLERPYAPFLENTTMGILPRHIWTNVSAQEFAFSNFNTQPIGAGPFALDDIAYNSSGIPTHYTLRSFSQYTLGRPYLTTLVVHFYPNEELLLDGFVAKDIDSLSAISSAAVRTLDNTEGTLIRATFPRIFGVFFNQNNNHIFTDAAVREALIVLIDKQRIVDEVLSGYGSVIDSPIPPGMVEGQYTLADASIATTTPEREERARTILEDAGWEFDETLQQWTDGEQLLTFSLATANTPELKAAAQLAAAMWGKAGIPVRVNIFETGELNQSVIRPRDYEALLFGEVVGRGLDLFAFWHSSQRDDPGLNIALYTNTTADDVLTEARREADRKERDALYRAFEEEVRADMPAVFLYSPDFLYRIPQDLQGVDIGLVTTPDERFADVHTWHTHTERVWHFFK